MLRVQARLVGGCLESGDSWCGRKSQGLDSFQRRECESHPGQQFSSVLWACFSHEPHKHIYSLGLIWIYFVSCEVFGGKCHRRLNESIVRKTCLISLPDSTTYQLLALNLSGPVFSSEHDVTKSRFMKKPQLNIMKMLGICPAHKAYSINVSYSHKQ